MNCGLCGNAAGDGSCDSTGKVAAARAGAVPAAPALNLQATSCRLQAHSNNRAGQEHWVLPKGLAETHTSEKVRPRPNPQRRACALLVHLVGLLCYDARKANQRAAASFLEKGKKGPRDCEPGTGSSQQKANSAATGRRGQPRQVHPGERRSSFCHPHLSSQLLPAWLAQPAPHAMNEFIVPPTHAAGACLLLRPAPSVCLCPPTQEAAAVGVQRGAWSRTCAAASVPSSAQA